MRFPVLGLTLILALAACGTPQEQCINRETRDLRIVDRLIAQLKVDIGRGYRMVDHEITVTRWVPCGPPPPPPKPGMAPPPPRMCLDDFTRTVQRPEAIDIAAETRKLAQLEIKRRSLARQAEQAVAACKAAYPE